MWGARPDMGAIQVILCFSYYYILKNVTRLYVKGGVVVSSF